MSSGKIPHPLPPGTAYLSALGQRIESLVDRQGSAFSEAAACLEEVIADDGILHTFGCGHSALAAAEVCYRAGGLAGVNFLGLLPGTTGWVQATSAENKAFLANSVVSRGRVASKDMVAVVSHSGESPLVLAVVDSARSSASFVLAVTRDRDTSLAKKADLALCTGATADDCALDCTHLRVGPLSTVLSAIALNTLITSVVESLVQRGKVPRVLESIHSYGGVERNQEALAKFVHRVPSWHRNLCLNQDEES